MPPNPVSTPPPRSTAHDARRFARLACASVAQPGDKPLHCAAIESLVDGVRVFLRQAR